MSAESFPIPAEALLQHRGFVRALARSLTRDEHAAEDLVQETWLEALRRPPRSTGALRVWLARVTTSRARNAARAEGRRDARERSAARAELDESEEITRERVMLQHRVVEAVLGLPEPYRTVVLLRYDQDLEPSEIAAKRGVPPGTIRSQLSRAHAMLRQKLDQEFDGSRAAWLVPLAALGAPRAATIAGGKIALVAASTLVVAATYVALVAEPRDSAASEPSSALASGSVAADPGPAAALDAAALASSTRQPVEQDPGITFASTPTKPDLERLGIPDLLVLGRQVQRELRVRLLTPDLTDPKVAAVLARVPDAQVARLLPYGRIEDDIDGRFLGISGAGAFWSFATRSNDYDQQPDVMLSGGDFSARGYGGTAGWICDLGRIDLADLRADPLSPPGRDERTREIWSLSWEDAHIAGRDFDRSIEARARALELGMDAPASPGNTYLIRKIMPGEHDLLAAFTVLSRDDYGYTIAGRVLQRWPLPEGATRGSAASRFPAVQIPDAPAWMRALDVPALLELSHRIRAVGDAKLFAVPEELAHRFPDASALGDRGFARMLNRFRFDAITAGRENGSYFTFLTRNSAFDGGDDLCLELDRFSVPNRGAIVDLGAQAFDRIERTGSVPRDGLSAHLRDACELLENAPHATSPEDVANRRAFSGDDDQRLRALDLPRSVAAVAGHTLLLRSVVPEDHDVLVALAVVDADEHGIWIRWRLLRSWPMDR